MLFENVQKKWEDEFKSDACESDSQNITWNEYRKQPNNLNKTENNAASAVESRSLLTEELIA